VNSSTPKDKVVEMLLWELAELDFVEMRPHDKTFEQFVYVTPKALKQIKPDAVFDLDKYIASLSIPQEKPLIEWKTPPRPEYIYINPYNPKENRVYRIIEPRTVREEDVRRAKCIERYGYLLKTDPIAYEKAMRDCINKRL